MAGFNEILGLGQDIDYAGKKYRISDDMSFGVKAEFERWMKQQAMLDAMAAPNDDEADKYRRIYFEDSAKGAFRFGGPRSRMAIMERPEVATKLLYLLLQDGHRKAPTGYAEPCEVTAGKMLDDATLGPWVLAICLQALGLNPSFALVAATGLTLARAETRANQSITKTKAELLQEIPTLIQAQNSSSSSGESSESIQAYLVNYLTSLGKG